MEEHDRPRAASDGSRSCSDEIGGDIVVHGSPQLAQALIERDLVDELRLMVYPTLLGKGKRLFGETSGKKPLELVESRTVGDGVAILVYRPAIRVIAAESRVDQA